MERRPGLGPADRLGARPARGAGAAAGGTARPRRLPLAAFGWPRPARGGPARAGGAGRRVPPPSPRRRAARGPCHAGRRLAAQGAAGRRHLSHPRAARDVDSLPGAQPMTPGLRRLYAPARVAVEVDAEGVPRTVEGVAVAAVREEWVVEDRWW